MPMNLHLKTSWGQFDFYKGGRFHQKPPRGGDGAVSSHSQKDNEFRENGQLPAGSQARVKHLPSDRRPRGWMEGPEPRAVLGSGGEALPSLMPCPRTACISQRAVVPWGLAWAPGASHTEQPRGWGPAC